MRTDPEVESGVVDDDEPTTDETLSIADAAEIDEGEPPTDQAIDAPAEDKAVDEADEESK